MRKVISITEVVGTIGPENAPIEICATADAEFDEDRSELHVRLDSYCRPVSLTRKEEHYRPDWLPKDQTLKEGMEFEEAVSATKDIFHRWTARVNQALESAPKG